MALDFHVISLKKKDGFYIARIKFYNTEGDYEISSNVNIRYNDFIPDERFRLSILDGFDEPFENNKEIYIKIKALSFGCEKNERTLEKAFFEFIKKEYSEYIPYDGLYCIYTFNESGQWDGRYCTSKPIKFFRD